MALGTEELILKIKFKSPNHFLRIKYKRILEDGFYRDRYRNPLDFYRKCFRWFTNKELLRGQVETMVQSYFQDKVEQIEIKNIRKKISGSKKIEFDINIERE